MSGGFHRCAAGLELVRGRTISCCTKVELFGANVRQGKETVHLVGNCTSLVRRQGRHRCYWWSWLLSSTATHLNKDNDHGCSDRKLIKCLTGSADDLSSLLACTHYLSAGLRVWAPPRRSLVRKL